METNPHKAIINRISRAEGQMKAIKYMLEEPGTDNCREFIIQIKAARAALKRASEQYVLLHINNCESLPKATKEKKISEAISLLASD
jgi:DNA-binding FrmR family transcriptional regulator